MRALVLAAGEGTRLRPLTSNTPKPLLLVAGKPFLSHLFSSVKEVGINKITLLVGWRSNRIKEYYGDGKSVGISIGYLEQEKRMGTAHAVGIAERVMTESFLCINGDVVISPDDIKEMMKLHSKHNAIVIGAVAVDDPGRFGVLETHEDKLKKIVEKPKKPTSNLVNAGIFVFTPEIFDWIRKTGLSPRGEFEITDTLSMIAATEDLYVYPLKGEWIDVGQPWDLLLANEILMKRVAHSIQGDVEEGVHLIGNVVIEQGARVRSGSYIEGPVYISKGCDIGPNCYLRPFTCLGNDVRVGSAVEIKNSIVMNRTHVSHHNYVGDSVIGERCNLGAGTKIANLRFDNKTIKMTVNGELIDTGRRKLGAIIGDDVKTGINSMINAGTIIGESSIIGPGALVKGVIGPRSKVF
ncbi:MAG: sugar phosphate nucleotidyltransferase [Methanomassiliicoccales archaeon]